MGIRRFLLNRIFSRLRIKGALRFLYALEKVGHPAEVAFPVELLPSGVKMHLRGFMTFHSVQINLDWVWPYWIEQQFNPRSRSFIPRAMNLTHVNQTHRNWTAVGVLGGKVEPVVDPRGLLTPWFDGWSLDCWIHRNGRLLAPSQLHHVRQYLREGLPLVVTTFSEEGLHVSMEVRGERIRGREAVVEKVRLQNLLEEQVDGRFYFSIRPYNPEGMSLIRHLRYHEGGAWEVNRALGLVLEPAPDRVTCSDQREGDVSIQLPEMEACGFLECEAGMATALSEYRFSLEPGAVREYRAVCTTGQRPYSEDQTESLRRTDPEADRAQVIREWQELLGRGMTLSIPDPRMEEAFRANTAFLHLFDDGEEITPGPLTYHRFWFRDAAMMINALDKLGYAEAARRKLATYPRRQRRDGFFISQNGEWDANGEAIWTLMEHYRLTGDRDFLETVYPSIRRGIAWVERKRSKTRGREGPERGLLPAGFSAEHLGPNDYYYWDDFWSLAGIRDGIEAAALLGRTRDRERFSKIEKEFRASVERSLQIVAARLGRRILPASPYRRMDAGAVGSISVLYPLRLFAADDERIANTLEYLRGNCFFEDGFFQNMIHSGVNPYLTAQIAQCYLYRRSPEAWPLIRYLLKIATPTYTWPEAVHPRTGGGCMGDGHHGWAAAEFLLLVRNLLFFEEEERLVITPIAPREWAAAGATILVEGAPSYFGSFGFRIQWRDHEAEMVLRPEFRRPPRAYEWDLPFAVQRAESDAGPVEIRGRRLLLPAGTRKARAAVRRGMGREGP